MKIYKTSPFVQNELKPAEKFDDVTNYGLWHLGRRDHSTNELREKLGRKTDNPEWIEQAINKLKELGYLDEKRFVDNFLRNCNEFKQYGPKRIRQEFRLKGADKDIVDSAMEESEFDYFEAALKCLNKKCKEPIEDKKERDRQTRFLFSRGFTFDMIRYAFEEHLKEPE
jgi:regulatory protein